MTSRRVVRRLAIAALAIGLPTRAAAQEPARSFDQLGTRVKVGDKVWVTDAQGREHEGKIRELTHSSLSIESHGLKVLQADSVKVVKQKTGHRFIKGMAICGAGGAGLVLAFAPSSQPEVYLAMVGFGVGIGAGVAALMPAKHRVVYQSGASVSSNPLSFSVSPVFTPRVKGIAVRFVF